MNKVILSMICLFFVTFQLQAQLVGKTKSGKFLLKGGTVVTVTQGTKIADLLIEDGKIVQISKNINVSENVEVIDCTNKYIYPGMTDAGCGLGLYEIGSIRLSQDANEIGNFTPQANALTAINPSSVHIPITRLNGVTQTISLPTGGLFPGSAAVIQLFGYTPQQMKVGENLLVVNFPSSGKAHHWDKRKVSEIKEDFEKNLEMLDQYWDKAKDYASLYKANKGNIKYNPGMEAMRPLFEKKMKVYLTVNKKEDILHALEWVKKHKVDAILAGVKEGYRVAKEIAAANVPVIVGPILDNTSRQSDAYDAVYSNAGKMHEAGILVAIRTLENENVRNLPFHAGFAAAYGLGKEEALKAVTINPAKILGIDDKIGSLEVGKQANLFVCNGDPFETKTQISSIFIQGFLVPIESRQTLLYDEYLKRDPGLSK